MSAHLNSPQREAVHYVDGPLLVLAGAGSGKTRVITHKIAYLINQCAIDPRHIAAITFTNKAALEMKERVTQLMGGKSPRGLTVSTFHALGLHLLRIEAQHLGYKPRFSVLDSADAMKIVSDALATTDKSLIRKVQGQISHWKNALVSPDQALAAAADEGELHAAKLYRSYQDTLFAYQAMDFDDLIRLPVQLFEQHPAVLDKWQGRLRYLLVDEYQDTNECQYRLLKLLAGVRAQFTAVGDDDQSIYAWRGANIENLRQLPVEFPRLKVIKLEQNYRSSARILRAANTLIGNNPKLFPKQLWSEHGLGDPIQVLAAKDEEQEAELVVMRLLAHKFEHRTSFGDYAILYRSNHQARLLEQQMRNQKVPYAISGGQSFFDRAEIKDLTSYLRLIANGDDDPAFIRAITTPKRGVGVKTLEKLGAYAAQRHASLFDTVFDIGLETQLDERQLEGLQTFCYFINRMSHRAAKEPAGQILGDLLKAIDYELWLYDTEESQRAADTKWKNVQDFVGWLARKSEEDGKTLLELTQTVMLMTMLDRGEDDDLDQVRLSTLHAAKGLEYGHVFIVGVEEEIIPHRESMEPAQVEEERRIMYVGITRAQRSLTLSYATRRKRGGEWQATEPSRFIQELAQDDLRFSGVEGGAGSGQTKEEGVQRLANLKAMLKKPV